MDIKKWTNRVKQAYKSFGKDYEDSKDIILWSELSEHITKQEKAFISNTYEILMKYFFKKAITGETFGAIERIKNEYGMTVEANYGLKKGPFINMAKTYWTFKIEVNDLSPQYENSLIYHILNKVELDIASLFFPTPGPMEIPIKKRIEAQKTFLNNYAPEIDIDEFIKGNPILKIR